MKIIEAETIFPLWLKDNEGLYYIKDVKEGERLIAFSKFNNNSMNHPVLYRGGFFWVLDIDWDRLEEV